MNPPGSRQAVRIAGWVPVLALIGLLLPVAYSVRTAWAAWVLFPSPVALLRVPTRDIAQVQRAAALAPGEASYAGYEAQLLMAQSFAPSLPAEARTTVAETAFNAAVRAVSLVPTNPPYRRLAASAALRRLRLAPADSTDWGLWSGRALEQMRAAAAGNPNSPQIHREIGSELVRAWDVLGAEGRNLALAELRRGVELEPGQLRDVARLLSGRLGSDAWVDALRAATPQTLPALSLLGSIMERHYDASARTGLDLGRQYAFSALDAYEHAVTLSELALNAVDRWVRAARKLSDEPSLQSLGEQLVSRYPARPESFLALAQLCSTAKCAAEALDDAVRLARRQSSTPGEPLEEAQPRGDRLLLAVALERRGQLHLRQQECERSLVDFDEVAELEPSNPAPRILQAECYRQLGQRDQRVQALEDAVRRDRGATGARAQLAQAYYDNFDYMRAIGEWRALARRSPSNSAARLSIARAYAKMGLVDQAIDAYSEVLEVSPEHASARREMTRLLARN